MLFLAFLWLVKVFIAKKVSEYDQANPQSYSDSDETNSFILGVMMTKLHLEKHHNKTLGNKYENHQ